MSQVRSNTAAFIEAEQYSQFILDNLHAYELPEGFYRDVSDFGKGTTLHIKTVGTVTIQEAAEDVPLVYNPIDTNEIFLTITDYVGDAWRVTDDLREDGSQVDTLMSMRALESTRALANYHEGRYLAVAASESGAGQTLGNLNLVNTRPHRWVAGGSGASTRVMTVEDFIAMKLAFDKANVPPEGRIAIVDPIVEATLNSLTNIVNVSNNPMFEGIVNEGFVKTHKFVKNIFGWDIWTSNFLPQKTATETIDASAYGLANDVAEVGDYANIFMSVADDNVKPVMHAWRRKPVTEGWRIQEKRSDAFQVTSRYGFGMQRTDTVGVILTSSTTY